MKLTGKNHVVDYVSITLLVSLLFFTIFSSSYLASKKTVDTKAAQCNCRWEEDQSVCSVEAYDDVQTGTDRICPNPDEPNDCYEVPITEYRKVGCHVYGKNYVCDTCPDADTVGVPPETKTVVETPPETKTVVEAPPATQTDSAECGLSCQLAKLNGGTGSTTAGTPETATSTTTSTADKSTNKVPDDCVDKGGTCFSGSCGIDYAPMSSGTCTVNPGYICCTSKVTTGSTIGNNTTGDTKTTATAQKNDPVVTQLANSLSGVLSNLLKGGTSNGTSNTSTPNYTSGYVSPTPRVVTPTPINTQNSFDTASGVDATVFMKVKFQGITKKPKDGQDDIRAKITLINTTTNKSAVSYANFVSDENGNWLGESSFKKVSTTDEYQILIKGPSQMQRKICTLTPTESSVGGYKCNGTIALVAGDNGIDASGIYLMAGDVGSQDGVANSYDLGIIKTRFGKLDKASLDMADINHDGVINSQDYSLVLQSLLAVSDTDEK